MFGKKTHVHVLATFNVCICAKVGWGRGWDLQPHQSMPKSYVQAVSNKLLNLIKRSGIILRSPEGPWTSAVMNTFLPDNDTVVLAAVTGTTFSKIKLGAGASPVQTEC